uniref:RRM domain-containing protein n=1 Tax=Branchiostoma floridae TaxID=7739 RepID=C3Y7T7_BRAFL|eukprot:XP_002607582.1 hypothetical protein BRAFLDRAFT_71460 [Branchiostoma floridae]
MQSMTPGSRMNSGSSGIPSTCAFTLKNRDFPQRSSIHLPQFYPPPRESLEATFSEYGEIIDCKVITDRETGRSRGFGFVTYSNDSDASEAKKCMNNTDLDGRQIRVDYASKKSEDLCFSPARVAAAEAATGAAVVEVDGMVAAAADMAAAVATEAAAGDVEAADIVAVITATVADMVVVVAAVATTM